MSAEEYGRILDKLDDAPGLVRRPLPTSEIDSIERDVGIKMPVALRAWLGKVGLVQDVSCVDASDFELHEKPEDLVEARKYIRELLGDGASDLFPFAHDGAGDEIAVRAAAGGDDQLIFVDHETRKARVHGSLREWMSDVVLDAVTRANEEGDVQKFWCVQFSFQCADEKPIFAAIETVAPVRIPDKDWLKEPATAAGVHTAKRAFVLLAQARMLSRSTYKGWASPHFSFDYEEPVETPPARSAIRRLDEVFRSRPELNYKLVDYGPLEWPPGETHQDNPDSAPSSASKKPWWKFW